MFQNNKTTLKKKHDAKSFEPSVETTSVGFFRRDVRLVPTITLTEYQQSLRRGRLLDKDLVNDRIVAVVKNFSKVDPGKVTKESHFGKDVGLDSLDTVEVVMAIEEEFAIEIPDAEADKILSIEEASAYIASNPDAK